jgi:hypothetical protein
MALKKPYQSSPERTIKKAKQRVDSPINTAPPVEKPIFRTRHKIIAALGISAAALFAHQNIRIAPTAATIETPIEIDRTGIKLGNVHFQLQDPEKIPPAERTTLFANMEKAYAKLSAYFGEEVMTLAQPYSCTLNLKAKTRKDLSYGETKWETQFHAQQQGGDLEFDKPKSVTLTLWTTSESYIAHEFVHLFAQPPIMLSQAFFEGHAYAIQNNLYGEQPGGGENHKLMENPKTRQLLDVGFDYNLFERDYLKGGVQDHGLNLFLKTKWEMEWTEFLKDNNGFFKKFYSEISKKKKQGKTTFTKNELLEIAETCSPNFDDWYTKKIKSMKGIGENGTESVVKAVDLLSKNTIVIINVQTFPKQPGQNFAPPLLKPALEGQIQATFLNTASGQNETLTVPATAQYFIVVDLPGDMSTTKLQKITIGGKEIALEK